MLARCVEGWGGSYGIRKLVRQGFFGRRFIEKINRLELVKASTYRDYEGRIEEYAQTTTNKEFGLIRAFGVGFFVNDEPASVL